jgi:hypothetical protein
VKLVVIPAANMDEYGTVFECDREGQRMEVQLKISQDRHLLVLGVKFAFQAVDIAYLMRSDAGESQRMTVLRVSSDSLHGV